MIIADITLLCVVEIGGRAVNLTKKARGRLYEKSNLFQFATKLL